MGAEQHVGGLAREEANTWLRLLETLIMLQGFERHLGDALPLQSALFLLKPDVGVCVPV